MKITKTTRLVYDTQDREPYSGLIPSDAVVMTETLLDGSNLEDRLDPWERYVEVTYTMSCPHCAALDALRAATAVYTASLAAKASWARDNAGGAPCTAK